MSLLDMQYFARDLAIVKTSNTIVVYTDEERAKQCLEALAEISDKLDKEYAKKIAEPVLLDPFMLMGGRLDDGERSKPKYPPGVEKQIADLRLEYYVVNTELKGLIDWKKTRDSRMAYQGQCLSVDTM